MNYEKCIEKLTEYFSGPKYKSEVVKAKENFFNDIGLNETDTGDFERNLNLFFDWYLFTRPLKGTLLTPAKLALNLDNFSITNEERPFFEAMSETHFGLFDYIKTKGSDHYVKDLLENKKITIKSSSVVLAITKGSIFSAHIIVDGKNNYLSNGIVCHPPEVRKFILEQIKQTSSKFEERWQLVVQLIKMYFKLDRYPHVKHTQIYSENNNMRF
ncbi:MAG: hypothetical protein H6623_05020 [Bdellovibrionaceae bacterium]|nr:hypothetical protein [Pseudobdellovibrionaceae bacterium]